MFTPHIEKSAVFLLQRFNFWDVVFNESETVSGLDLRVESKPLFWTCVLQES